MYDATQKESEMKFKCHREQNTTCHVQLKIRRSTLSRTRVSALLYEVIKTLRQQSPSLNLQSRE